MPARTTPPTAVLRPVHIVRSAPPETLPAALRPAVLIAGCDPDSTDIFTRVLEAHDHPVVHARSATDVLDLARLRRPGLVLLGAMPTPDLVNAARAALKAHVETADIPVIALRSVPAGLMPWADPLDADLVLDLPITPRDLVQALSPLLRAHSQAA